MRGRDVSALSRLLFILPSRRRMRTGPARTMFSLNGVACFCRPFLPTPLRVTWANSRWTFFSIRCGLFHPNGWLAACQWRPPKTKIRRENSRSEFPWLRHFPSSCPTPVWDRKRSSHGSSRIVIRYYQMTCDNGPGFFVVICPTASWAAFFQAPGDRHPQFSLQSFHSSSSCLPIFLSAAGPATRIYCFVDFEPSCFILPTLPIWTFSF
jgi:hypothetical protein